MIGWELQPHRGSLFERLLCRIGLHLFMPDHRAPGGASCCLCSAPWLKDSAIRPMNDTGRGTTAPAGTPHSPKEGT